jgi:2-dehydro-3-deoxyphosphogalactonate aldolase
LPFVAILRGVTPDELDSIAAVIVEAGFGAIEVPLNSPDQLAGLEDQFYRKRSSVRTSGGIEDQSGNPGRNATRPDA